MEQPVFDAESFVAFLLQVIQLLLGTYFSPLFAPIGSLFFLNFDLLG